MVLVQMFFRVFGNCKLLLKALVLMLLLCDGLSPTVFLSRVLDLFLLVQGVHFGCILILLTKCFSELMLMTLYFQLQVCLLPSVFTLIIVCIMIANSLLLARLLVLILFRIVMPVRCISLRLHLLSFCLSKNLLASCLVNT